MPLERSRQLIDGVWVYVSVEQSDNGGGGGSQTLAQVLAEGDDAAGQDIANAQTVGAQYITATHLQIGSGDLALTDSTISGAQLSTDMDADGSTITNLADPTNDQDADTKAARDAAIAAVAPTADQKAALDAANAPDGGNPFATMADAGVTSDQKAALDAANSPDAGNPFATIDDLGGGGVANPLAADLLSGGFTFKGGTAGGGTGAFVAPGEGGPGDFQGDLQLGGGDGAAGKIGGQASMSGGGGDAGAQSGAQIIAGAGTSTDPGVVQMISAGVYFEVRQAAFVANGSTVDQLRDSLIAAGLMAAS